MALPLLPALGFLVGSTIFKLSKELFKWGVFITFIGMLVTATVVFWGFVGEIYSTVQASLNGFSTSYGGLLGCVIHSLGIDDFLTSFFAIFVSASVFWGTAVGYIVTFKFGKSAYLTLLKLL